MERTLLHITAINIRNPTIRERNNRRQAELLGASMVAQLVSGDTRFVFSVPQSSYSTRLPIVRPTLCWALPLYACHHAALLAKTDCPRSRQLATELQAAFRAPHNLVLRDAAAERQEGARPRADEAQQPSGEPGARSRLLS